MPRIKTRAMAGFSGTSHNEKRFAPPLASFTLNQPAGSFGNIFNNATAAFDAITSVWSSSLGKPSSAAIMKAGLAGSEQQLDLKSTVVGLVQLGGLLSVAATYLSPTGPGGCDHNPLERCCNCATSVPFMMVGVHAIKNRRTTEGKVWGASMVGVGMASTMFHASSGAWREWGRRMDYWSIAASSSLLLRAVYPKTPTSVTIASMAMIPFKPFLVSSFNSAAMELKFLHRARKNPKRLGKAQMLHASTCLLGLSAFALEDYCPQLPLLHSAWHCLSAAGVSVVNNLLDDVEKCELGLIQ